jgi:hypothetical protein
MKKWLTQLVNLTQPVILILALCGVGMAYADQSATSENTTYRTAHWDDLIPEDDLDALVNPPMYLMEIEDGSPEDQIGGEIQKQLMENSDSRYQQALVSTRVMPEMDGQSIRIPGFVVPLEFDDEQVITEFFLVPYFGACIHTPPPPPNQIIYVNAPTGLTLEYLSDPFWISGTISTKLVENDMASAAYSLEMDSYELYGG